MFVEAWHVYFIVFDFMEEETFGYLGTWVLGDVRYRGV